MSRILRIKYYGGAGKEYLMSKTLWVFVFFAWFAALLFSVVSLVSTNDTFTFDRNLYLVVLGMTGIMLNLSVYNFKPKIVPLIGERLFNALLLGVVGWGVIILVQVEAIRLYGFYAVQGTLPLSITGTGQTALQTFLTNITTNINVATNEELAFRHGLQPMIESGLARYGRSFSATGGIIGQAVLFMFYHVVYSTEPAVLFAVFLSGIILGVLHFVSKRTEVPIIAHFLVDLL